MPKFVRGLLATMLLLLSSMPLHALAAEVDLGLSPPGAAPSEEPVAADGLSRSQKAWLLNAGIAGGIVTWGVLNWDYFSQTPQTRNEQWLGHGTKEGGADKFGHLWSSYAMTHGFAAVYLHIGYPEETAGRYAAYSTIALTGLMEVGDSFSDEHGFSYEDMVANTLGTGIGYLLLRYPEWHRKIDLRWEYNPEFSDFQGDIATDYQHAKYLLAIKAEGFDQIDNPFLQALELHLGYYARGYDEYRPSRPDDRKRYIYTGIGVNVSRLIRPLWDTWFFNYIQLPYTYVEVRDSLE